MHSLSSQDFVQLIADAAIIRAQWGGFGGIEKLLLVPPRQSDQVNQLAFIKSAKGWSVYDLDVLGGRSQVKVGVSVDELLAPSEADSFTTPLMVVHDRDGIRYRPCAVTVA